jgi:hypothetical protein
MIQKFREFFILFAGIILFFVIWLAVGILLPPSWRLISFAICILVPLLIWLFIVKGKKEEK